MAVNSVVPDFLQLIRVKVTDRYNYMRGKMKFLSRNACVCLMTLLISSCATVPDAELRGVEPTDYKNLARAHIKETFPYPESLRDLEIAPPSQGIGLYAANWIVCIKGDWKYTSGDYSGLHAAMLLFKKGKVILAINGPKYAVDQQCANAIYEPFSL